MRYWCGIHTPSTIAFLISSAMLYYEAPSILNSNVQMFFLVDFLTIRSLACLNSTHDGRVLGECQDAYIQPSTLRISNTPILLTVDYLNSKLF